MKHLGIASLVVMVMPGVLAISGCSIPVFESGFEGSFTRNGRLLVGYSRSHDVSRRGILRLGTAEREECEGEYEISKTGISFFGAVVTERIFDGQLVCLDGRVGNFRLVSKDFGKTGVVTGEIAGNPFRAKLYRPSGDCNIYQCGSLTPWPNANELKDAFVYDKVRAEHKTMSHRRPNDGM